MEGANAESAGSWESFFAEAATENARAAAAAKAKAGAPE